MSLYCVLSAILGPGETSGNKINNSSCPREGASLAGVVASFYFDECCTCSVLERDSAGGWTPWLLLSLRSSGSWGWDSSFESVWEETEMKLSIGEHGGIGKKRSSVRPMVNSNGRVHLVMIQGSKRWKSSLDRGRKLPNSGPRAWELGWGSSVKNGTVLSKMDHCRPQSWNSQFWGREEKSRF